MVIVNYESGEALLRCVEAWRSDGASRLVVVDNGSRDGSVDRVRSLHPALEVIDPGRNLGYGAAANRGVAATDEPLIVVCNPDLDVRSGALAALAGALAEHPRRALVGPMIRTSEGARYPSARRFPSLIDAGGHALLGIFAPDNRFTRAYQHHELDDATGVAVEVDWVSGACFLVRRSAFEEVGGFDESYFMYAEDVDLCWRLREIGWSGGVCAHGRGDPPAGGLDRPPSLPNDRRASPVPLAVRRPVLAGLATRPPATGGSRDRGPGHSGLRGPVDRAVTGASGTPGRRL